MVVILNDLDLDSDYLPDQVVQEALSFVTGVGAFKEAHRLPNGQEVTYTFSWATGMRSLHYLGAYRAHFHAEPPAWVAFEHPYHRGTLLRLAREGNRQIPPVKPISRNPK